MSDGVKLGPIVDDVLGFRIIGKKRVDAGQEETATQLAVKRTGLALTRSCLAFFIAALLGAFAFTSMVIKL